ncbi:hypothetical protein TELCIR_15907 [Teladorsagia circumcincta]|uniref:Uncharacterized protein n=1 Tax=Teladorsagia circumcincta TaxID=45464 RepID=A0A2G9TZ76_TELCI|nr:hypothetical protein TELCIR_15907 [Teladorsagia circumcincta]
MRECGYYVFVWPKNKPQFLLKLDASITRFCQLISWTVVDSAPLYTKAAIEEFDANGHKESQSRQTISTISRQISNDTSNQTESDDTTRHRLPATKM